MIISYSTSNVSRRNRLFIIIVCCHAILFRALANPFNYTDTENYSLAFSDIRDMSFEEAVFSIHYATQWGHGFVILNWIIGQFTSNSLWLFVIISIISVGGIILYYARTSYSLLLTMLLYLMYPMMYYMGFGVVRQHLAIVFVMWAIYFIDNTKLSILLLLIATSFHVATAFIFIFYLWRIIYNKIHSYSLLLVITILGALLMRGTYGIVLAMFPKYLDAMEYHINDTSSNILPIIIFGFFFLTVIIENLRPKLNTDKDKELLSYVLFGFMISLFCYKIQTTGRLSIYFIYALPSAMTLLKKYSRTKCLYFTLYVLFVFLITIWGLCGDSYANMFNYKFLWEQV